jgi:hypothetical protein
VPIRDRVGRRDRIGEIPAPARGHEVVRRPVRDLACLLVVELLEDPDGVQQRLGGLSAAEVDRGEHVGGEPAQVRI